MEDNTIGLRERERSQTSVRAKGAEGGGEGRGPLGQTPTMRQSIGPTTMHHSFNTQLTHAAELALDSFSLTISYNFGYNSADRTH